jgi:hypothetical protein
MKKIFLFVGFIMAMMGCVKQHNSASNDAPEKKEDVGSWKEMDDFHMAMAYSYHPFRDSANLAPAKLYAVEMRTYAEAWAKSNIPAHLDEEKVRMKIEQLNNKSSDFVKLVEAGHDEAIAVSLDSLHTLFHDIHNLYYQGDSTHQHHHH